jgi:protein phosphatase 1 regulatory subunit 7
MENLGHLTALTELWLGKNKIVAIEGIEALTQLQKLDVQSNRLERISGLSSLTALKVRCTCSGACARGG